MTLTWDQLSDHISRNINQVIEESMHDLKQDLQASWPIDTSLSKDAFRVKEVTGYNTTGWAVVNHVSYTPYLWQGLPNGSKQMPLGADPIYDRWLYKFRDNLKETTL